MIQFGEHLMIDGYNGEREKLDDKNVVIDILKNLPNLMEMHILSKPEVYRASGNNEKDPGGWSGFVVIQESHISVHTFPLRGFVSADIYTCKNGLDRQFIISYFKEKFNLQDVESNFVIRGTRYPDNNIY